MTIRLGRSLLWRNALTLLAVQAVVWVVAVSVAGDDQAAASLVTMVVAAISVATILILAMLARSIGRQTRRATDAARRFADGDFSGRLREDAANEFRELAVALNAMAGELDSNIDALQVQTSEMLSILQSRSNGLIALDREQRIIRLNAAALGMFALADVEIRGRLLQEVIREPALQEAVKASRRSGVRYMTEIPFERSTRIAELVAEPLTDGRGVAIGTVILLEETTRLRQLERIRTDFAANVSHELRTPITSINGYAELLQETDDPALVRKCGDVIVRNGQRLSNIIEDLLTLARIEDPERRSVLELEAISVASIIESVVDSVKSAATDDDPGTPAGPEIIVKIEGDPRVQGTRPLLEQAVGNLVTNAVKYGGTTRPVEVKARVIEGEVTIEVEDFGDGISSEHLDRIFERFYRVDRSRSRELGGTGLGLAIVKHIATSLGGRIEARSRVGAGSAFTITLPAH
ncbi:MAG: HAMP domain-containing protein [Planctomycetia bacterium]|nr:HAMP domain-containing protein [Planctomycetia bacterium]